jgi:hypothetical protein
MAYSLRLDEGSGSDDLRSLASFLAAEPELRGRVTPADRPAEPGHLGAVTDVLLVAAGSGGALSVLAGSVAAWVQARGSTVTVTIEHGSGRSASIAAERVKGVDAGELRRLVADVEKTLREADPPPV